jgi:hypothetical protein
VYNANLRGYFAAISLEVTFTAVGDANTHATILPLSADSYSADIETDGIIKYVLEVIIVLYIVYAFIFTEFKEVRCM